MRFWFALGLGDPILGFSPRIGTGDVPRRYQLKICQMKKWQKILIWLSFSLIGRPNVGKSSLINAILGEERAIASPVAIPWRYWYSLYWQWRSGSLPWSIRLVCAKSGGFMKTHTLSCGLCGRLTGRMLFWWYSVEEGIASTTRESPASPMNRKKE